MSQLSKLSPERIKQLNKTQLDCIAREIRQHIIQSVSVNGGHLASNLGVVELTLAIHKVFDSPKDKILWDVGHQCYTHKIITGRADDFASLRKVNGLSGFPKPNESEHDAFIAGHSSSSVSIAHGMATASKLKGESNYTLCIIGDGSIAGGMAFEAMNNCARGEERLIVVLNDNKMSIGKSVGALSRNLMRLRNRTSYFKFKDRTARFMEAIPLVGRGIKKISAGFKDRVRDFFLRDNIFQKMGFVYLGPVDGHNIKAVSDLLERAKQLNRPVLVHVNTIKGKGYEFAETSPDTFHGLGQFDIATGSCEQNSGDSYSVIMGKALSRLAEKDGEICAVSAAMVTATGLDSMPENRLFDVGMAEEHAVSFTAGLAKAGMKPVCAIYSSFLQRAYDQINQDICLANVHAVLCIDRAGIVGEDGETHQGLFDVSFLTPMPNITVYSPSNGEELKDCLKEALYSHIGPVALRYPRGSARSGYENKRKLDGFSLFTFGNDRKRLIVTYGRETDSAVTAAQRINCDVISLCRIKPIPHEAVRLAAEYGSIVFAEEGMRRGGIGEALADALLSLSYKGEYKILAVEDEFVKQGTVCETLQSLGLDADGIALAFEDKKDAT